ncbi:MAG: DciA family protein [Elusimicrobia bacterium]|nr:DciA family protein [Elusimicrobiota bacterium]
MKPDRTRWATGKYLADIFKYRTGIGDKTTILGAAWRKELGHLSAHWELSGIKQGIIYVKPRSAAAAQELQLRAASIVRGLNKYFNKPWIKGIKVSAR